MPVRTCRVMSMVEESNDTSVKIIPSIEPIAAAKLKVTVDTEYVLNDDLLEIHSTPIQKEITNLCIAVAPAFSQTPEDSVSKLSVNPSTILWNETAKTTKAVLKAALT